MKRHFKEEIRYKTQLASFDREIENLNWSLLNKRAELSLIIKEKGASNIQVKIINEEIEEVNQNINQIKHKHEDESARLYKLQSERDRMQS